MEDEIMLRLERIERYAILGAKEVLTINEAALLLGMAPDTVRRMARKHEFPCYKPNKKTVYFKKSDLEGWMLKGRKPSKEEDESNAEMISITIKDRRKKRCSQ